MAHRPPRLPSACYLGPARVFLTTCVHGRQPRFADEHFGRACVVQLMRVAEQHDVAALAYCLMPDHAHLLLQGRSAAASSFECAVVWKQRTASMAQHRLGVRLWQDGVFDRVLRGEDDTLQAAVYVLANPVRSFLAARLGEYPLAGSAVFSMVALAEAMQARGRPW
jgi:putative transposase